MHGKRRKDADTWSALGTLIILQLCFTVDSSKGQHLDYCAGERFNPECQPDEVVVIKSAYYGRMHIGRCIQKNVSDIGCYADARPHLDSKCSGRRTCNLSIPDSLNDIHPCPANLQSFLEASYTCIKVESASCHMCQSMAHAEVTQDKGYLASVVSQESQTGCGTVRCPWRIEVPPGHRVNLTLIDFDPGVAPSNSCLVNAVIKEKGSSQQTICHSSERESHAYLSRHNVVQINIARPMAHYMVYSEAVGCSRMDEKCEVLDSTTSATAKLEPLDIGWPLHYIIVFFLCIQSMSHTLCGH